jgi:hypothetical protein
MYFIPTGDWQLGKSFGHFDTETRADEAPTPVLSPV